jgi:ABC-2 type transport system permease protein
MKRYLKIYCQLVIFSFKSALEYRWNFVLQLFYGPAYVGVLFTVMQLAYSKAPHLGGFSADEAALMFAVINLLYVFAIFLYIRGVRYFLWQGIRLGQIDLALTKPVNPQLYISFQYPEIQQIALFFGISALLIRQIYILRGEISLVGSVLFVFLFLLGLVINYFIITTYAAIGFFVTRAQQILEFFDKASDYAAYPTTIFPLPIKLFSFSVVPIAFFSFVPSSFLLGRGSLPMFIGAIFLTIILFFINQFVWREGLKHYSSASS